MCLLIGNSFPIYDYESKASHGKQMRSQSKNNLSMRKPERSLRHIERPIFNALGLSWDSERGKEGSGGGGKQEVRT